MNFLINSFWGPYQGGILPDRNPFVGALPCTPCTEAIQWPNNIVFFYIEKHCIYIENRYRKKSTRLCRNTLFFGLKQWSLYRTKCLKYRKTIVFLQKMNIVLYLNKCVFYVKHILIYQNVLFYIKARSQSLCGGPTTVLFTQKTIVFIYKDRATNACMQKQKVFWFEKMCLVHKKCVYYINNVQIEKNKHVYVLRIRVLYKKVSSI